MRYSAGERALGAIGLMVAVIIGYISLDILLGGKLAGGEDASEENE